MQVESQEAQKAQTNPLDITTTEVKGHSRGRTFTPKRVAGWAAVIAGIILLATAVVFASGVFGGGHKYMIAGGSAIGATFAFALGTLLLLDSKVKSQKRVPNQS